MAQTEEIIFKDILGNGRLILKVPEVGVGATARSNPKLGDEIDIIFTCQLEDGRILEKDVKLKLVVGQDDYNEAFDLCLPHMTVHERGFIKSHPEFTLGANHPAMDVPTDQCLFYDVYINAIHGCRDATSILTLDERISYADKYRERGNKLFGIGNYERAIRSYSIGLGYMYQHKQKYEYTRDQEITFNDLRNKNFCNLGAAQIKIGEYEKAIKSCDVVIVTDPSNIKGYFRKGQALRFLGRIDEAIGCLQTAISINPNSTAAKNELSSLMSVANVEAESQQSEENDSGDKDDNINVQATSTATKDDKPSDSEFETKTDDEATNTKKATSSGWYKWAAGCTAGAAILAGVGFAAYRYFK